MISKNGVYAFSLKGIRGNENHSIRNAAGHAHKIISRNTHQILLVDQAADLDFESAVTDLDFESAVLLARHIQSGHGKLYIESFGLLSSTPLESLCDLMFSSWRFKLFHLENNKLEEGGFRYLLLRKNISNFFKD